MDPVTGYLLGLALLLTATTLALVGVQRPLCAILTELCGAEHRARFWARLYDASVLMLVLFCSLCTAPDPSRGAAGFLDFVSQLRAGMFGLLVGLGTLAISMAVSIGRFDREQRDRGMAADGAKRGEPA